MRCLKANRGCDGYEDMAFSEFRQYGANHPSSFISTARKCSLPIRIPLPGTDILPEETLPPEVSQAQSNALALRTFFYDYCLISTNSNLSRGFLSSLETMAYHLGLKSDLVKACQAVAFACNGKPLHRPKLVRKAEVFYQELLGSLAKAIENRASANAAESKLVAMLLGLHQVAESTCNYSQNYDLTAGLT